MASVIRGSDNFDSADIADIQGAKAWVNFNGTGTVAIREDFNVSSITDNGTGNYTVNFTTALTDTNYTPCLGFNGQLGSGSWVVLPYTPTLNTGSVNVRTRNANTVSLEDSSSVYVAIFR